MIICVTGPMAAGKNYVCSLLENRLWISLDADKAVHAAIKKAEPLIFAAFEHDARKAGINLRNNDNSLNRRALGSLIFPRPHLLAKQESIVYPILIEETRQFIAQNAGRNIILNATVLYKTPELLHLCDRIIFVTAPKIIRFFRARNRDHMNTRQILQRFRAQKTLLNEYKAFGIPVIIVNNNGSAEKLKKILNKIFQIPIVK